MCRKTEMNICFENQKEGDSIPPTDVPVLMNQHFVNIGEYPENNENQSYDSHVQIRLWNSITLAFLA